MTNKLFFLSLSVIVLLPHDCHCQSVQEAISQTVSNQWNALNTQISMVQGLLTDLSRTVTGLAESGTKNSAETLQTSYSSILNQLSSLQKSLTNVANQVERVVESGAKLISGDSLSSRQAATAEIDPNNAPVVTLFRTVDLAAKQLAQVTTVVEEMSHYLSQMLVTGVKVLEVNRQNATDNVLEALEKSVNQIAASHKSLSELNTQFSEMLRMATRSLRRKGSNSRTARAESRLVTGIEKIANDLTREFGQIGNTLAKIAAGISGVRIPGVSTDSRGNLDNTTATFQGLNPLGVIRRGFGNVASSIAQVVPNVAG